VGQPFQVRERQRSALLTRHKLEQPAQHLSVLAPREGLRGGGVRHLEAAPLRRVIAAESAKRCVEWEDVPRPPLAAQVLPRRVVDDRREPLREGVGLTQLRQPEGQRDERFLRDVGDVRLAPHIGAGDLFGRRSAERDQALVRRRGAPRVCLCPGVRHHERRHIGGLRQVPVSRAHRGCGGADQSGRMRRLRLCGRAGNHAPPHATCPRW
jgi:hypothetical protein